MRALILALVLVPSLAFADCCVDGNSCSSPNSLGQCVSGELKHVDCKELVVCRQQITKCCIDPKNPKVFFSAFDDSACGKEYVFGDCPAQK
jgi:hypothetical protein